ncbi:MAG: GHMP kinase [Bacteroidia bacterium]|nr:GHMP kinase [Bacteroidia bacterium]NNF32186.1 GHMP kinase [Flavobacteriaceae bacterium]MBT8276649.1 GHMP kinase [Bacteroidia bacterium]NNJ82881.1 GHMP kinase [Flavobacteriaceae bacterium]NNK55107.1 GHMP kinase [Flavobacteriaceae bacterium]
MQTFHSNGKLLLTGEYLVLDGALALAIPTVYGQSLSVSNSERIEVSWTSLDMDEHAWYKGVFSLKDNKIMSSSMDETSELLLKILRKARQLNPDFLDGEEGYSITTKLNFPRNWGLGTSSTLINNIAQWAEIDGFKLLSESFGGSGYDIAAAQHESPILYSNKADKPVSTPVRLPWKFTDRLYFIHLNIKQDSKEGIALYRKITVDKSKVLSAISALTLKIVACEELTEFTTLMEEHETIISQLLGLPKVKDKLFPDYPGLVKSLGAWGGDFILVSGDASKMKYFTDKGYPTIIPFTDMLK